MPEINQLPTVGTLKPDDLVLVFSTANGDARKASVNTFAQLVAEQANELVVAPSNAVPQAPTPTGAAGVGIKYSREDHSHPSDAPAPANVAPAAPAPAPVIGSSLLYARQDHAHISDAPDPSTVIPTVPTTFGAIGTSGDYARADHSHPSDAPIGSNATPQVASPAGSPGGSAQYSRGDHSHPSSVDNSIGSSTTRAPSQAAVGSALLDKEQASTAMLSGGVITIAADPSKVNITAVTALFVDNTDPTNPVSTLVTTSAFLSVTLTNLATQPSTYLGVNSSGAVVQQNTPFTAAQRRTIVSLGLAIHSNNTVVNAVNQLASPAVQLGNQMVDLINAVGPLNLTGNEYSPNGANLNVNKSAGVLFKLGAGYPGTLSDPNQVSLGALTALTFRYRMSNSTETADRTAIDPTQYQSGGTLVAVSNNKFTVQRIYMFQSNLTRIQWGQAEYNTMADAINGIRTEPFVVEANAGANGVLRGFLVVKKETTALNVTTDAQLFSVSKFGAGQANGAGSVITGADVITALGYTPENAALKGAANGYAPLNASSLVPLSNLPAIATPAINTPLADSGAGSIGSVTTRYALEDHVHPAGGGGTGTVTTVSVVSANGMAGSVANPTSTPAITLTTTVNGIVKGNGTALSAAVAGDFPTLNQNTTGTASNVTGVVAVANGGTGASTLTSKGILFGNGTSAVGVTAVGTAGQVLTSNGAGNNPTFQNASGGGGALVFLGAVNTSGGSLVNFLNSFNSTYDDYEVHYAGLAPGSGTPTLSVRLAYGGAADASNYHAANSGTVSSGAASTFVMTAAVGSGFAIGANGIVRILNANGSFGKSMINNSVAINSGGTAYTMESRHCLHNNGSVATGVQLLWDGTITFAAGGYVRLYGVTKS